MKAFRRYGKSFAAFCVVTFFSELIFPSAAYALTGGPSQPEVQSFEPVGTTEMVNLFTGDFTYNIPLMDIGGYPVNLSYHGGPSVEEEASWVGYGWNLNPGVINRQVRGLPDDYNGETIEKKYNIKNNHTIGLNGGLNLELFGFKNIAGNAKVGMELRWNNYTGVGHSVFFNPSLSVSGNSGGSLTSNLGINSSSEGGVTLSRSLSLESRGANTDKTSLSAGVSGSVTYNSLTGIRSYGFGTNSSIKLRGRNSINLGASDYKSIYSYTERSYTPYSSMSYYNFAISAEVAVGLEGYGVLGGFFVGAYYNLQKLKEKNINYKGYGYMYAHNGNDETALHDLNREHDGTYSDITIGLPLASHTFDTYSVTGQGIGGSYRAVRNDVGTLYDARSGSGGAELNGIDLGLELGGGGFSKIGVNVSTTISESRSGIWEKNDYKNIFAFTERPADAGPDYEPFYFKESGDPLSGIDEERFNALEGSKAVRPVIDKESQQLVSGKLVNSDDQTVDISGYKNTRTGRAPRNQNISFKTNFEASRGETFYRNIRAYRENNFLDFDNYEELERDQHPDQISEITVTKPGGERYVYGIPALNTETREVVLATDSKVVHPEVSNLITIGENEDSQDNRSGRDGYYSSTKTPGYAHSYLLTAILSPDYEDTDQVPGPSDGDRGNFVLINYSKTSDSYQWRSPYETGKANYNDGYQSIDDDNKASFIEGKKEIWYMHSMVSRNHIAEFYLAGRGDSKEAAFDNADAHPGEKFKRLDRIELYSRSDRKENGAGAVPLKTVHFEYNYELCNGTINSAEGGKLTLKSVYFTFDKSRKGMLSPYAFEYYGVDKTYGENKFDRWGTYKDHDQNIGDLNNIDFPYTPQQPSVTDQNASVWSLSQISLPSGGIIHVEYESDDYAYVQDKRAMQMVPVLGAGENTGSMPDGLLYGPANDRSMREYIFFDLPVPVTGNSRQEADENMGRMYLRNEKGESLTEGNQYIYYNFEVELDDDSDDFNERLNGYLAITSFGVVGDDPVNGQYTRGYIQVKAQELESQFGQGQSQEAHPVSKNAWQFIRQNNPEIVFEDGLIPRSNSSDDDDIRQQVGKFLLAPFDVRNHIQNLAITLGGYNRYVRSLGFARRFIPDQSYIRLYTPENKKLGGGQRVRRIALSDQWQEIAGGLPNYRNEQYGQEYSYTIDDPMLGEGISSGVASYEPISGGDENVCKQPVFATDKLFLAPDNQFMQEKPFGESFYPGAMVGYRRVTVTSLRHDQVRKHGTGSMVHEFYTAKDFPIPETDRTDKNDKSSPPFDPLALLKNLFIGSKSKHVKLVSQGYAIETNDMHGKPKAVWVYGEGKTSPLSGTEYIYQTSADKATLDNTVQVIGPDGNIREVMFGVEQDVFVDLREQSSNTYNAGLGINVDVIPALFFPLPVVTVWPKLTREEKAFRSATITKVTHRHGILKEVVQYDNNSRISVANKLYDGVTGEVVLTQTINSFNDPVFQFKYPAHWYKGYEGMGPAFYNQDLAVHMSINNGTGTIENAASYFFPGDKLLLIHGTRSQIGWVTSAGGNQITIQDRSGSTDLDVSGEDVYVKVIRSGRKNISTASIGSITLLNNPVTANNTLDFTQVINATANTFYDNWKPTCDCAPGENSENPYINGTRGDWRLRESYAYLDGRKAVLIENNTNIRKDGVLAGDFKPFWLYTGTAGDAWRINPDKPWIMANRINAYSPTGFELENKDALGNYSAALYGHHHSLPTGVAANSKQRDIGFDGFEDYDSKQCDKDHFSFFERGKNNIVDHESHSGRRSLMVPPNGSVSITKTVKE